jgi:hypothetical protein
MYLQPISNFPHKYKSVRNNLGYLPINVTQVRMDRRKRCDLSMSQLLFDRRHKNCINMVITNLQIETIKAQQNEVNLGGAFVLSVL